MDRRTARLTRGFRRVPDEETRRRIEESDQILWDLVVIWLQRRLPESVGLRAIHDYYAESEYCEYAPDEDKIEIFYRIAALRRKCLRRYQRVLHIADQITALGYDSASLTIQPPRRKRMKVKRRKAVRRKPCDSWQRFEQPTDRPCH